MIRKLGVLLLGMGVIIVVWNSYQWWVESQVVSYDPALQVEDTASYSTHDTHGAGHVSAQSMTDFEAGEGVEELTIPKLGKRYPVYYGSDQETLEKGIGMYDTPYTTRPSEGGHTALAGHRETTFTGLDGLVEGDFLYLTEGNIEYEYQINKIWVTDPGDTSVIVPKSSRTLTLTTCYPFDFIGSAPERYIVQAVFVKQQKFK